MSDHLEIQELLEGIDVTNPATYEQYASVKWRYKDDSNNNNYNSGAVILTNTAGNFPQINQLIRLDTKDLIDMWIGYRQSFWFVPMTYTIGGTTGGVTYTAPNQAVVGIKNGLHQLVHAFQFSINGTLVNQLQSQYINMVNHLHAMIEDSVDYAVSTGVFEGISKDTLSQQLNPQSRQAIAAPYVTYAQTTTAPLNSNAYTNGANASGIVWPTSYNQAGGNDMSEFTSITLTNGTGLGLTAAAGANSNVTVNGTAVNGINTQLLCQKNPNFNRGFFDRINFTNTTYTVANGVGTGQFNACIPLKSISDFFRQLSIPLLGAQFSFILTLASPNLSTTQPLMVDVSANSIGATNAALNNGQIASTLSLTVGNMAITNTRLYFPEIKFNPETQAKINSLLDRGFRKTVTWMDNIIQQGGLNQTSGTPNCQISAGITKPQRVILLTPRTGAINSTQYADPAFSVAQYTNVQLLIDTKPLYEYNLQFDFEFYNNLKQLFIGAGRDPQDGSLISYIDFLTNYRYYVFDCSRMINAMPNPDKQVTLQFQGQRIAGDTVAVDQYFIVEAERSTILDFSNRQVKVIGGTSN